MVNWLLKWVRRDPSDKRSSAGGWGGCGGGGWHNEKSQVNDGWDPGVSRLRSPVDPPVENSPHRA